MHRIAALIDRIVRPEAPEPQVQQGIFAVLHIGKVHVLEPLPVVGQVGADMQHDVGGGGHQIGGRLQNGNPAALPRRRQSAGAQKDGRQEQSKKTFHFRESSGAWDGRPVFFLYPGLHAVDKEGMGK